MSWSTSNPFLRRWLRVLVALIAFGMFVVASPASAHNSFVSSDPAENASIAASVGEWSITFANNVPLDSASAEVIGEDGVRRTLEAPVHGDTEKVVIFPLPDDLAGPVTGRWRLVSDDGHVVSGRVQFVIASTANPVETTTTATLTSTDTNNGGTVVANGSAEVIDFSESNPASEPVRFALRLLNYAALLFLGGLMFTNFAVSPGILMVERATQSARVAAVALAAIPAIQAVVFVGDVNAESFFPSLWSLGDALSTTPGSMMLLRATSGAVFAWFLFTMGTRPITAPMDRLLLGNATVYLTTLAYAGHSRSSAAPWLGIPTDVVHTAASAVWLGGLAVLVVFVIPRLDTPAALRAFERYGTFARYAVIGIIATGLVQSLRMHGGVITLFTTAHGRVLLMKVVVVALMLKVGDINRRRLLAGIDPESPRADRQHRMLVRASITESALGGVVVAITAVLVTSSLG